MRKTSILLPISVLFSAATWAHTPYIKPLSFEPVSQSLISLDASFAEQFFVPEVAISNANFEVIQPDGTVKAVDTVFNLKTRNVLEQSLEHEGTYQFSTGKRMGPIFRVYELDGERGSVRGEEPLPEGAILKEQFRSVTSAVTYVSKKAPSDTALKPKKQGLEIIPNTHPNNLFTGDTLRVSITFNGRPLADHSAIIYHAKDQFSEESDSHKVKTNAEGMFDFSLAQGLYLVQVRHKADAPASAEVPTYSYTTTLTLEAF